MLFYYNLKNYTPPLLTSKPNLKEKQIMGKKTNKQ